MAAKGSWDHGAVGYTDSLPQYQGLALGAVSQEPCPKTPEKPATAAKKYSMGVEDYQPYSDDRQHGVQQLPEAP